MKRDLYFKDYVLFVALKNIIANTSIYIHEGCRNYKQLQEHTLNCICICMKAYYNFLSLNKKYTRKEMAMKKYNFLYTEAFKSSMESDNDLSTYLDSSKFSTSSEIEQFIILSIYLLPSFFKTNNMNKIKHILNTYIPKVKNCMKNSDKYLINFDLRYISTLDAKAILFKFLVENS